MIPVYQVPEHALRKASELLAKIVAQRGLALFKRDSVCVLTIDVAESGVDWNLFITHDPETLAGEVMGELVLSLYREALAHAPGVPVVCAYTKSGQSYNWAMSLAPGLVQARGQA